MTVHQVCALQMFQARMDRSRYVSSNHFCESVWTCVYVSIRVRVGVFLSVGVSVMCIWIAYQPCTHFFIFQSIFKCILFGSYIPVLLASFFPPLLLLLHHHVPSAPLPQTRPSKAQITSSKEGHITSGHQLQTSRVRQRGQRWERGGYVWCMRGGDLCVVSGIGWYDEMVWCGIG